MIWCLQMVLMRFAKIKKQVETKMIPCLHVALYQSLESRTKKRFTQDSYLDLCTSQLPSTLSFTLPYCIFWVIKRKEKNPIIFLYNSVVVLPPCIQHRNVNFGVKINFMKSLWTNNVIPKITSNQ